MFGQSKINYMTRLKNADIAVLRAALEEYT